MLSEKMQNALNEQIREETFSAYLYFSMEAYFKSINLNGFATWMRVQALEELTHATKFFDFIHDRGGKVSLLAIEEPQHGWENPLAVFEATLAHERHISSKINELVDIAIEVRDHAANAFLQWFVNEQVEEEATADDILQKTRLVSDGPGLYHLDMEMGKRVFTPPTAAE